MQIPLVDVKAQYAPLVPQIRAAFDAVLEDGKFVALDAHMDMENEARPRQKALLAALGVGDEETRQAREATPFELAGEEVDAQDHRGHRLRCE